MIMDIQICIQTSLKLNKVSKVIIQKGKNKLGIFILLIIAMLLVVKFCKKTLKIVLSIIIVLISLYCIIISVDMNRVHSFREPIFATIKLEDDLTMKTKIYQGLGYEVKMVKDVTKDKIIKIEMYMFDKVIAGAVE